MLFVFVVFLLGFFLKLVEAPFSDVVIDLFPFLDLGAVVKIVPINVDQLCNRITVCWIQLMNLNIDVSGSAIIALAEF